MAKDKKPKKEKTKKNPQKRREIRWEKLDNTAHLFPVIAGESMTNTYRIAAELTEDIDKDTLQRALDRVLPRFDLFNVRMRAGVFWNYFEENNKPAPKVREEDNYPCRFIVAHKNRSYMFRVTYFKKRINLEVFHVLTDGTGGFNFMRELVYQYIRLAHPDDFPEETDILSTETSMNTEDSFVRNYRQKSKKQYKTKKALQITGTRMSENKFGVISGYMDLNAVKEVSKKYGVSINTYFVAAFAYAIYMEYAHPDSKSNVRVAVPVNLRPYFDSVTTKNFFTVVSAELPAFEKDLTFEKALEYVKKSLGDQITKEHLEEIFSYNVSNQMMLISRLTPLFIKHMVMRAVYRQSALANSTTITNVGNIKLDERYEKYVTMMHAYLAVSTGQLTKATVCSYKGTMLVTFSSILKETAVQRRFFRQLSKDGIEVTIETNGVYS